MDTPIRGDLIFLCYIPMVCFANRDPTFIQHAPYPYRNTNLVFKANRILSIYRAVFRHGSIFLFTAQSQQNRTRRWAFGPLWQEKYLGPVTLTTVSMGVKKHFNGLKYSITRHNSSLTSLLTCTLAPLVQTNIHFFHLKWWARWEPIDRPSVMVSRPSILYIALTKYPRSFILNYENQNNGFKLEF